MAKDSIRIKVWVSMIIFALSIFIAESVSSISLSLMRDPGIETQNLNFISMNSNYFSTTVLFRYYKKTALDPVKNIILGITCMDYNSNRLISPYYYITFQSQILLLTQTGMNIGISHIHGDLKSVSVSLLIIAPEYRYISGMMCYDKNYTNLVSYQSTLITTLSTNTFQMNRFLAGINIQTHSSTSNINYSFNWNNLGTNPVSINTAVNINSDYNSLNYINLKILIYSTLLPATEVVINLYTIQYTSGNNQNSVILSSLNNQFSEVIVGLRFFTFRPNSGNLLQAFKWSTTSLSNSQTLSLTLDDQIQTFNYRILVINSYGCTNPSYPFLYENKTVPASPKWECYDQCYSNQYVYFNPATMDYMCSPCNAYCVGCFAQNQCKQCIPGYDIQQSGSCLLNSSYYTLSISSLGAISCEFKFTGCSSCTRLGQCCLSCKPGFRILSSTLQTYPPGNPIPNNINNITCGACNLLDPNCLLCNFTTCFSCQPPYQLLTPTLCRIPPTPPPPVIIILPCSDNRCKRCLQTALDDCLQCYDKKLTILNGKCMSPCGDGIVLDGQKCDDGNTLPYDGCSSDCLRVQSGWVCHEPTTTCHSQLITNKSICHYNQSISLRLLSIKKSTYQNKLIIKLQNSMPYIRQWSKLTQAELKKSLNFTIDRFTLVQGYNFSYSVRFVPAGLIVKGRILQVGVVDQFDPQSYRMIQVEIPYDTSSQPNTQSLNHQLSTITFQPSLSYWPVFTLVTPTSIAVPLYTDQNHLIQSYPSGYYQKYDAVKMLGIMVSIGLIAILVLSLATCILDGNNSRQMLLTVETAAIVQFTYFSLIGIGQLNPLFIALAQGLKLSNGQDLYLSQTPTQFRTLLGVWIDSSNISDNVNLSIAIPIILLIIGLVMYVFSRIRARKQQRQQMQAQKKQRDQLQLPKQQEEQQIVPQQQQTKLQRWSKTLISNFGFGIFLFFLYKYTIFTLIQLKYGSQQIQGMNMIIISLIGVFLILFILLILIKLQLFSTLTKKLSSHVSIREKLLMQDQDIAEELQQKRQRKRKIYLLSLILAPIINSTVLILLSSSVEFYSLVPIALYILQILYIRLYDKSIYNPPNKYRLYLNYGIGVVIQLLLMIRKVLLSKVNQSVGGQESSYAIYLPYSIVALLILLVLNAMAFLIYSIKRTRCCQLEIEWEKVSQQLEDEIKEAMVLKAKITQNVKKANSISNNHQQNDQHTIILNNQPLEQSGRNLLSESPIQEDNQQESQSNSQNQSNSHNSSVYSSSIVKSQNNARSQSSSPQKKISKKEINKQLKQMLKKMKILRSDDTQTKKKFSSSKQMQQEISQRMENDPTSMQIQKESSLQMPTEQNNRMAAKRIKTEYHYTDKRRYNFYEEYDRI